MTKYYWVEVTKELVAEVLVKASDDSTVRQITEAAERGRKRVDDGDWEECHVSSSDAIREVPESEAIQYRIDADMTAEVEHPRRGIDITSGEDSVTYVRSLRDAD